MDELPEDEDSAAIADNLCGAAFDWAYFDDWLMPSKPM
jgi:hypothetical protein